MKHLKLDGGDWQRNKVQWKKGKTMRASSTAQSIKSYNLTSDQSSNEELMELLTNRNLAAVSKHQDDDLDTFLPSLDFRLVRALLMLVGLC